MVLNGIDWYMNGFDWFEEKIILVQNNQKPVVPEKST